ncbi:MAG: hypothetical protein JSW55_02690 [Chloroflexota bacterium]|nr:MAG: hypothetical protein JSW55_02690 [Chloroflexota bacterium]
MAGPTHASLLEAALDKLFMGAFHRTGADRISLTPEIRVINHRQPSLEVVSGAINHSGLLVTFRFGQQQT